MGRDRFGELTNRSPLLAQILSQMQQHSRFQPQNYGALAAGLGATYLQKKTLDDELRREQEQKQAQGQALSKALKDFATRSQGGQVNIPIGNVDGGSENLSQALMADPQGARQNLMGSLVQQEHPMAQALAGQLLSQEFAQKEQKRDYINAGDKLLETVNGVPTGNQIPIGISPDTAASQAGADTRHQMPSGDVLTRERGEESRFNRVGAGAQYAADRAEGARDVKTTASLRKEFRQLPTVKKYETILPDLEAARKAPDTGAGDLQLIYTTAKLLDPDSAVKEGETAMVLNSFPALQNIIGQTRFTTEKGGRLTPKVRGQVIAMLEERANTYQQAYDRDYQEYSRLAGEQGADPASVVGTRIESAFTKSGGTKIESDAEFAKLPSGAVFVGPDGKTRRKP